MSISFVAVKCPSCGVNLHMEEGRRQMYCSFCGTSIVVTNENEHIYRRVDEEGIKKAETDRIIKIKQMELDEKRRISSEKDKVFRIKMSIILGIVGALLMIGGFIAGGSTGDSDSPLYMIAVVGMLCFGMTFTVWPSNTNEDEKHYTNTSKIRVPNSVADFKNLTFDTLENLLKNVGFTNIKCIPLNDIRNATSKKIGLVDSILINGNDIIAGGKKFEPDATVIITYHSLVNKNEGDIFL